ncbi:putative transcription factor MYB family [Helianthus annuus]|nr:putative transcription factor MYB family [Helianthus annuus]
MDVVYENYSKPELESEFKFEDDFPIDTKGVFQDFHNVTGSSFNPDYTTHVVGYDPFGLLPYGLGSNDDFYEFKPVEQVNDGGNGMVVNFNSQHKSYIGWTQTQVNLSTRFGLMECSPIMNPKPMSFFVADEGSCVTADNGTKKGDRKSGKGKSKSSSSKGQWTKEEDRILKDMVEKYGVRKWSYIAQMLRGRIGKQCRERWHNHLRPDIKKDFWTEEEDRILIAAHAEVGNKWSEIAKKLPGRTENSTKNHWNATKRRQYTRRKCRSKWPRPSPILQNYIKSLNLPRGRTSSTRGHSLTVVKSPSPPSVVEEEKFDFNEVPELDMDERLLEWDDNIDSLLDDLPCNNSGGGDVDPYLQGATKEMDLMEMISHVNL